MKFGTKGTLPTEAIIDVSQRIVAQLQDADVTHVFGLNVYMSVVDKTGERRELALDGQVVEALTVACDDLMVVPPEGSLSFAEKRTSGRTIPYKNRRRRRA